MDIRVAHSEALDRGGALVVAEELARTFGCDLFVGFRRSNVVADDVTAVELFDAPLVRWLSERSRALRDGYFALAWQHAPDLHEADVVVESGNNPGWYVPLDTQTVVRYVHSTPYAAYHRFPENGDSFFNKLYGTALRTLYAQNIPFPDVWIANSELVARRVRRYWGIDDVEVVYPPIDVDSYHSGDTTDYYLTFSHLRKEKRIDEIIHAFEDLDEQLVVGGDGPDRERLERIAPTNVQFLGYLDESEKRRRLAEAKALIFNAQAEDFGIVPIEAFASGTPVIGVNEGYTRYQIQDGRNGVLYDRGVDELRAAIREFDGRDLEWLPDRIRDEARRYDIDQFRDRIRQIVANAHEQTSITLSDT